MPVTLEDIYEKHKEWLYITDTKVIDLKLAMEICRQIHLNEGGKPLWMILVAPSGSAKTELLETMLKGIPKRTHNLTNMTSKTLVSGMEGAEDLAPKLNQKLVIVPDASRFTSMRPDEKKIIFSQFRDLYDGFAGKRTGGTKSEAFYPDLKVTMLWGAVPKIEREIVLSGQLGTRFVMYFHNPPDSDEAMDMMLKRMSKGKIEKFKRETGELERILCDQIKKKEPWNKIDLETVSSELKRVATRLAYMRATADIDWRTGTTVSITDKEEPTRIFGQFMMLYRGLMSLDPNYSHDRAMEIIKRVADSSGERLRAEILDVIKRHYEKQYETVITTSEIAEKCRVGDNTVRRHCYILWRLEVLARIMEEKDSGRGRIPVEAWALGKEADKI